MFHNLRTEISSGQQVILWTEQGRHRPERISARKLYFFPLPLVQTFVGFCPYKNGVCLDLHPPLKFWTELNTLSTSTSSSLVHCIIKKINFSMIQIGQSLHIIRSKTNMQIHLFLNKILFVFYKKKKIIQKHA